MDATITMEIVRSYNIASVVLTLRNVRDTLLPLEAGSIHA
jgi:hypothetical protein